MQKEDAALDLLWGVSSIANFIGRTDRQTHFLLSEGEIPGKKIAGRWCASRAKLVAFFEGEAA